MAIGDFVSIGGTGRAAYAIEILATVGAANGAPSGTAGISADTITALLGYMPEKFRIVVMSTAGSGVMTVTARLWHRLGSVGWTTTKALNASSAAPHTAVAIPETGTDTIAWSEEVSTINGADRYYLEIIAVAGTTPSFKGLIVVAQGTD